MLAVSRERCVLDVHKEEGLWLMWTHVDRGGGRKFDFFVDVINGWPLGLTSSTGRQRSGSDGLTRQLLARSRGSKERKEEENAVKEG